MKDQTFRIYEEYVLSEKKIDQALKSLVEGSVAYQYLKSIDLLTKKGANLTAEEAKLIQEFIHDPKTSEAESIKLRYDLLQYDTADSVEKKKEILEKIAKQHLHLEFNHERPQGIIRKLDPLEETKEEAKSLLDAVDIEAELAKLYEGKMDYRNFSNSTLAKVDYSKLPKETFFGIVDSMGSDLPMLDSEIFFKTYAMNLAADFKLSQKYSLSEANLSSMTIQQLDGLKKELPGIAEDVTFALHYVTKLFNRELSIEENNFINEKDKRKNLIKMYEYSKELPHKLSGLKSILLLGILDNGLKQEIYDETYFLEYIQAPVKRLLKTQNEPLYIAEWSSTISNILSGRQGRNFVKSIVSEERYYSLLAAYLTHFFKSGIKMEKYSEYFEPNYLVEAWEDSLLTSGQKVELTPDNTARIEKLAGEVLITICPNNKEVFSIGEEVSLILDLKNIPLLYVKVFEINTENYYRKEMAPFTTDINLDGLVASIEKEKEFKQPPQILFREELLFPELKGKSGLFVIELIGNGKSSRAIIKIGTLSYISKQTIAGQLCFILDGDRKVCCHETTGIWMDNSYFKANVAKNGAIPIPFIPSGGTKVTKAILLHQGLAQLIDFERVEEVYTLKCGFFLLPESFIMGNKAEIVVRPQLLINGRNADLALLSKIKCILYTSTYIDNILSSKTYDNLTVSASKELLIPFQVGAQVKEMRLEFFAEVKNISKNKVETLIATHTFDLTTHINDFSISELYLRLISGLGYQLNVLGKNGEPIPNQQLTIDLYCEELRNPIAKTATTSSNGTITLGHLQGIKVCTAKTLFSGKKIGFEKTWVIPSKAMLQYSSYIDIIEGEKISMPFIEDILKLKKVYLKRAYRGVTFDDCSSLLKVVKEEDSLYSILQIEGLLSGEYTLSGIGGSEINIRVHRGIYWKENGNYILKQYSILENTEKQGYIKIKGISILREEERTSKITISVEPVTKKDWRLHVLLFKYLPENIDEISERLSARDQFGGREWYFQEWKNFFLSNRELSSEYRYCFERRQMARFTGNTLEKPKMMLKRTLIKSTITNQEVTHQGTSYEVLKEKKISPHNDQPFMQSLAGMPEIRHSHRPHFQVSKSLPSIDRLSLFQNFILNEPRREYNLTGNEEGRVVLELEKEIEEKYGALLIIAVDKGSVAHYIHTLKGDDKGVKDLSLLKPLNADKFFAEMRTTTCVKKFDTHIIDDLTSSDIQIIDSLDKVLLVIKELMRLHSSSSPHMEFFEKLTSWGAMSMDEKMKTMSRYTSHELHLFLYKKDPEFFANVVRPFLRNKVEKTFMDYFFLDDMEMLMEWVNYPARAANLNSLEKALLVEALVRKSKKEQAAKILKGLSDDLIVKKTPVKSYNTIFDTVLSLNMLKMEKNDIESLINLIKGQESKEPPIDKVADELGQESNKILGSLRNQRDAITSLSKKREMDEPMAKSKTKKPAPKVERRLSEICFSEKGSFDGVQEPAEGANMLQECALEGIRSPQDDLFEMRDQMMEDRTKQKPALEELGETKEYGETHYYGGTASKNWPHQVSPNELWKDYMEYVIKNDPKDKSDFISSNFIYAHKTFTEAMAAISLIDLPYTISEHGFKTLGGRSAELKAASNLIVFKKEVKECKGEIRANVLVAQRYVDWESNGDEDEKIEEYLTNHIYKSQVIITNISSCFLEFDLLVEIPQGSLPVSNSPYQKSHSLHLGASSTTKLEHLFYFPHPGKFLHFPANVSINAVVIAKASTTILQVVKEKSKVNEERFLEILATENKEAILNFLRTRPIKSIKDFSWSDLYYLLKDKAFQLELVSLLKQQNKYEPIVWSYSLFHKDNETLITDYLNMLSQFKSKVGLFFTSRLLNVQPIDSGMMILDYHPLVNPRAHKIVASSSFFGGVADRPLILNVSFYQTYQKFVFYLIEKPIWDAADKLNLTYYLLLQDRVKEALAVCKTVDSVKDIEKEGSLRLQYDYMTAYLDFYTGAPEYKIAKSIVGKYTKYPIVSWRDLFLEIEKQLNEYEGKPVMKIDTVLEEERKEMPQEKPIDIVPQLSLLLEGKELLLDYRNVKDIIVKFYIIDLEILFSRTPFLAQNTEGFSFVQPNYIETLNLDPKVRSMKLKIPEKFVTQNTIIEVVGGGIQRMVTYFSASLKVHIFENYGEVKVTDEIGKPLQKVYVKVFILRNDEKSGFYKDGYTDIRGRFDYVSLNSSRLSKIKKFGLFIMSDSKGSVIRECPPPTTTIRPDEDNDGPKARAARYYGQSPSSNEILF